MAERLSARETLALVTDSATFSELPHPVRESGPDGPLAWQGYDASRARAADRTGESESVICGTATVSGTRAVLIAFEFGFLGGSLGERTGDRLEAAYTYAREHRLPVVPLIATGGSRMQEGMIALTQLQRVARQSTLTREAGLPQIAVLRDPTTGGGWATLGAGADVILALPDAQVGFAGSRVRPPDADPTAYTAEAQVATGAADAIVAPADLKETLGRWLHLLTTPWAGQAPVPAALGATGLPAGGREGLASVPAPGWEGAPPALGEADPPVAAGEAARGALSARRAATDPPVTAHEAAQDAGAAQHTTTDLPEAAQETAPEARPTQHTTTDLPEAAQETAPEARPTQHTTADPPGAAQETTQTAPAARHAAGDPRGGVHDARSAPRDAPDLPDPSATAQEAAHPVQVRQPTPADLPATGWEAVQRARSSQRPRAERYLDAYFTQRVAVSGDRCGGVDAGMLCGFGEREGRAVAFAAQAGTATRPAGYRTAARLIRLADRLGVPVLTLVDTPGAANDAEAERQGAGAAIADLFGAVAGARVPVTTLVIGEGGSGGALALAAPGNTWATPDSYFSVIAPEAAAAILKRPKEETESTADQLRVRPQDLVELGVVRATWSG
ncbi:acetyl-CoA carboxylase carboxyl transferase subunit alpha/beta [Streptomyces sp. MBT65]|uniref:carboxyl transferase domain-containing protein n=1 Tax=Streptomyces sp. MBT65 TaxID=1488395 RepID=UPI00190AC967|nr:carboxyl transferase domain-containing protein [Streptomyces sp. MBT65]MBK3578565.1 acetyl-CoA carboxylase carboxyl transferase subunit alpha/beta [Streptomyces sp. MBT65]